MTKEQKILLMFVLAIAASSATYYVVEQKKSNDPLLVGSAASNSAQPSTPAPLPVTPETPGTGAPVAATQTKPAAQVESRPFEVNLAYVVPNGNQENISVKIVLNSKGVIEDVAFSYETPSVKQSVEYLGSFSKNFKPSLLVGKNIQDAQLSRVGGASLTTKAFNKALTEVANRANI